MKNIAIAITDGVGYRNFVLNGFLEKLSSQFNHIYVFSAIPIKYFDKLDDSQYTIIELLDYKEPKITWFYRKLKEVAHLRNHKKGNFAISRLWVLNKNKNLNFRGFLTRLVFFITEFLNSEKWILYFNTKQKMSIKKLKVYNYYNYLFKKHQIDLMFFTHQRPPYIAPLVYVAEDYGIKTSTFIFSWDNLASKGRMAAEFDEYFVWSELMKNDLKEFYKNVKSDRIHIVGTPQFETYRLKDFYSSKSDFLSYFKLNPAFKTITYSCGDSSVAKNDPYYIDIIAFAISNNQIEKVNFIVRTSPADDGKRFQPLVKKYPFISWNFPDWNNEDQGHSQAWSQRIPTKKDLINLQSILRYSDLGINMCSTMSIDFMLFDKPVINPVMGTGDGDLANDQKFLKFPHYKTVVESNSVDFAKSPDQLIQLIAKNLSSPLDKKEQRIKLRELQIGQPLENTSERIVDKLENIG